MNRFIIVAVAVLGACSVEVREDQKDSPAIASAASQAPAASTQAEPASVMPEALALESKISPFQCNGTPGQWNGCRGNGCAVCAEKVTNAPCYFQNHPSCTRNTTCAGQFFTCNEACPAPSGADLDCNSCGACPPPACGTCADGSQCCFVVVCDDGSFCSR